MKAFELRTPVALLLLVMITMPAFAQAPWTVTITPTMNPLPVGFCGAVQVTIRDASGSDVPRNPQGYRITLADFDMAVASPNATSVVGQQIDATHWSVCACQGAAPGTDATITASYPARALPEAARVKDASLQVTAGLVLAAPKGTGNPPVCIAALNAAVSKPARVAVGAMPVLPPMTVTPAPATTRPDPVGQVSPKGAIGERVAPYVPGPLTVNVDMNANGSWFVPGSLTANVDVDAHGSWFVPGPLTVTVEMSAAGSWAELTKNPLAPREPVLPRQ
jgi:hypothetical protein